MTRSLSELFKLSEHAGEIILRENVYKDKLLKQNDLIKGGQQ